MKLADILETSEGLKRKSLKVVQDEELDKAELLIFRAVAEPLLMSGLFNNTWHSNFWSPKRFVKVLFHD